MHRKCKYGIIDEGEPLKLTVKLYPIKRSFMNTIKGVFSNPYEQTVLQGGLYVKIEDNFMTF